MEHNATLQEKASKAFMLIEKALGFIYYSTGAHLVQKLDLEKTVIISYKALFLVGGCILLALYFAWLYWRRTNVHKSDPSKVSRPTSKKGKGNRKTKKN
jgi:hypothetical protein